MSPGKLWGFFAAVLIGVAVWFVFSPRYSQAPPDIVALELVRGDFYETPSCFSLGTVVAANRLDGSDNDASVVWTMRVRDEWTMRVQRGRSWSAYTFLKQDSFMVPVRVAFSDDLPQLRLEQAIDGLLVATRSGAAPRMTRCGQSMSEST